MNPYVFWLKTSPKASTSDEIRLPLSFNSHDGKFVSVRLKEENHATKKMEPKIVSDVNELRYVSSQLTPIEATQSADNKVKMEAIVHYVNLLVQLDGALSAKQIMSKRSCCMIHQKIITMMCLLMSRKLLKIRLLLLSPDHVFSVR